MDRGIARRIGALDAERRAFLQKIGRWAPEQLRFRPVPRGWSALQVLDHVQRTEAATLAHLRDNRCARIPHPFFDRLRISILIPLMRLPVRVPAPRSLPEILPSGNCDLKELIGAWDETRRQLHELVETLGPDESRCALALHPVCGWMNLPQTLAFLAAHIHHHRYQIDRIGRHPGWQSRAEPETPPRPAE